MNTDTYNSGNSEDKDLSDIVNSCMNGRNRRILFVGDQSYCDLDKLSRLFKERGANVITVQESLVKRPYKQIEQHESIIKEHVIGFLYKLYEGLDPFYSFSLPRGTSPKSIKNIDMLLETLNNPQAHQDGSKQALLIPNIDTSLYCISLYDYRRTEILSTLKYLLFNLPNISTFVSISSLYSEHYRHIIVDKELSKFLRDFELALSTTLNFEEIFLPNF